MLTLGGDVGWCREPPISGTPENEEDAIIPPSLPASRLLSTPLALPRNSPGLAAAGNATGLSSFMTMAKGRRQQTHQRPVR